MRMTQVVNYPTSTVPRSSRAGRTTLGHGVSIPPLRKDKNRCGRNRLRCPAGSTCTVQPSICILIGLNWRAFRSSAVAAKLVDTTDVRTRRKYRNRLGVFMSSMGKWSGDYPHERIQNRLGKFSAAGSVLRWDSVRQVCCFHEANSSYPMCY